jgi:hypothetical protein
VKYPVIYVIWKDHAEAADGAWADATKLNLNKLCTAVTIGFLVHEDEEAIQVATTYVDEYEIVGRPDIIAKALIVYRTELDVKEYIAPKRRANKESQKRRING